MPNWCFAEHKSDFGKFWLGNVIELFGGNWEKINCRGRLHDLEKRCRTEISFRTVTAWGDLPEIWDFLLKQYPSLKYYFYAEECGNCYYATNNHEGKYFPDRFIVDKYAEGSTGYTTRDETMKIVSAQIVQPVESWADMLSKVAKFNEDNQDNEIYIYEIRILSPKS